MMLLFTGVITEFFHVYFRINSMAYEDETVDSWENIKMMPNFMIEKIPIPEVFKAFRNGDSNILGG